MEENMKFVHIADIHFDSPFVNLSDKDGLGDLRRLEQRKAFKKVIEYIKENDIKYLFISGDLYEQKYIKKSTIEYINNLFNEIPTTKIFIAPGNHDPYVKNSYYNKFQWNENVKIFNSTTETTQPPTTVSTPSLHTEQGLMRRSFMPTVSTTLPSQSYIIR